MSRVHPSLVRQVQLEEETWNASLAKYDNKLAKLIETGAIQDSKEVILIIKATIDTLSEHIEEYLSLSLRGNNKKCQLFLKHTFGSSDNIAYVLIKTLLAKLLASHETKLLLLSKQLVTVLSSHNNIHSFREQHPKLFSYIENHYKRKGEGEVKKQKKRVAKNVSKSITGDVARLLGSVCVDLVHKSGCNLIDIYKDKTSAYNVKLTDEVKQLFLRSKFFFGNLVTAYYPLVHPPKPWAELKGSGGYYTQKNISFIKTRTKRDMTLIERYGVDLDRLMGIVNNIQNTPYRVNKRVLQTITTIIKYNLVDHRSTVSNPILYGEIPMMETLNLHELVPKDKFGKLDSKGRFIDVEAKKKWLRAMDDQDTKIRRIESKRLAYKMALEVAHKFKDEEEIYFSYNLDFRGRLYPIQNYLHPQMSGNIKCMLEFGNGQVLDAMGLFWLKVHGANCYGYDKLTYNERVEEIDKREEEIRQICIDPISNIKLWYEADSPLLYLAFCFSYGDYLDNPKTTIHLPVQLDATCSGIQIYSGLLKDRKGAEAVNVIGAEKVNDIYQDVADKVQGYLASGDYPKSITYHTKDGKEHTRSTSIEAMSIKGKITRKLTKRNVMTQPYSVTRRGMYEQVYELLNDYEDENKVFWAGEKWVVATLISKLNDRAIGEIVKGAKRGQSFLKEVLRNTLKTEDNAFWYSPIYGFPVLQRIKKERRQRLRTPLGSLVLYHPTEETHYIKMLNGIAPNYIHSLDCTLLYRTVERCLKRGVNSFWLIHDSYGVLPNDVPILNEEFRGAYIELFKNNPLADWVEQVLPLSKLDVVGKVMINDLDLEGVREAKYIIN